MTVNCPRCDYQVSEEFVFCPRCAKIIWPHLKKDIPRRFSKFAIILGGPAFICGLLGLALTQELSATVVAAGFGLLFGLFLTFLGFLFDAWD